MKTRLAIAVTLAFGWLALAHATQPAQRTIEPPVPLADHHQHLFSPELAALMSSTPPLAAVKPRTAADLIEQLDAAGIKRAVVLSTAYIFEQPSRKADDAAGKLRRDNDWTSRQVAQFPDRLIGFCGVNPLKDYALEELARCAADPNLRRGLKLHFGNSVVDHPTTIHDVHATILQQLGLDHRRLTFRFGGRDVSLTDVHGEIVRDILA